jgi:hypothetical protein
MYVARFDTNGRRIWARQFGTASFEVARSLIVSGGTIVAVGSTNGAFTGTGRPGGNLDVFVATLDTRGRLRSMRQFGTDFDDDPMSAAMSGGRIFLAGSTTGAFPGASNARGARTAFVARIDMRGAPKWVRQFDPLDIGTDSLARGVAVSGTGVFVVGQGVGTFTDFNSLELDGFVTRYDFAGNRQWFQQFGTANSDTPRAVAVRQGRVYIAGDTLGAFTGFTNVGNRDGFLARFSTTGTLGSIRQFGTSGDDFVNRIALRRNNLSGGALVIAGETDGTVWGQTREGTTDTDLFVWTALS